VRRRMSGLKTDEIIGGLRRLPNDELHNLYSSPNIIRINKTKKNEMDSAYGTHGREEKCV
jgi:hypothetical protein